MMMVAMTSVQKSQMCGEELTETWRNLVGSRVTSWVAVRICAKSIIILRGLHQLTNHLVTDVAS